MFNINYIFTVLIILVLLYLIVSSIWEFKFYKAGLLALVGLYIAYEKQSRIVDGSKEVFGYINDKLGLLSKKDQVE